VVASTARMMFVTGKQQATKTMQATYQPSPNDNVLRSLEGVEGMVTLLCVGPMNADNECYGAFDNQKKPKSSSSHIFSIMYA